MCYLLSLVVPVFNGRDYIARSLENLSRIHAISDRIEIIVIDDGSTDGTDDIIHGAMPQTERFKLVIQRRNQGPGPARNTGMGIARGKYIWCIDADDIVRHEEIENILAYLDRNDPDVAVIGARAVGLTPDSSERFPVVASGSINSPISGDEYYEKNYIHCFFWRFIVKSEILLLNKILFTEILFMEDVEILPRIMLFVRKIFISDIVAYDYILRPSSLTLSMNPAVSTFRMTSMLKVRKRLGRTREHPRCGQRMKAAIDARIRLLDAAIMQAYACHPLENGREREFLDHMKAVGLFPFTHVDRSSKLKGLGRYALMKTINFSPLGARRLIQWLYGQYYASRTRRAT